MVKNRRGIRSNDRTCSNPDCGETFDTKLGLMLHQKKSKNVSIQSWNLSVTYDQSCQSSYLSKILWNIRLLVNVPVSREHLGKLMLPEKSILKRPKVKFCQANFHLWLKNVVEAPMSVLIQSKSFVMFTIIFKMTKNWRKRR